MIKIKEFKFTLEKSEWGTRAPQCPTHLSPSVGNT